MPTKREDPKPKLAPIPTLMVDGAERPFYLGVNQWCELEAKLGKTTGAIVAGLAAAPEFATLRRMTAVALSNAEEVFSEEEAAAIIEQHGMPTIAALVAANVERLMGTPDKVA